jgi:hypothetical protein
LGLLGTVRARSDYGGASSLSPTLLLLTGDPVYTCESVLALIIPGRFELGKSNGLAWLCIVSKSPNRGLVPGVATGFVV